MMLESVLSKLAAAGLATKAAAGGAAVVVAASAAGAADALPEPAQDAFDGLVAVETADEPVLDEGELDEGDGEVEAAVEDTDADNFGARVSADATGESDGEPGVDGCEIAREASGKALENCGTGDNADADESDTEDESGTTDDFGDDVAEDAEDDGVDGKEVAEAARERSEGGDEGAEDAPTDDADDDDDDDSDDGDGPEGTPGEGAGDANRPSDEG